MTNTAKPDPAGTLWYTRCPVPTASGLAHSLGWLGEIAHTHGLDFGVLQDAGPELAARHFDHTRGFGA